MLAVSPLRSSHGCGGDERDHMDITRIGGAVGGTLDDDFSGMTTILDDINFDDLFMGLEDGGILLDLEVDAAELLGDVAFTTEDDASGGAPAAFVNNVIEANCDVAVPLNKVADGLSLSGSQEEEEVLRVMAEVKEEEETPAVVPTQSASSSSVVTNGDKGRLSSLGPSKAANGKRKVKVDWTPELHRRFVQAVEQLGVDKAVPSRILELMGIDCLTRHNIASHLQKYRSHRKHLLAREAEAASWSQRRQICGKAAAGGGLKKETSPRLAPMMGLPHPPQHLIPLHVWGHPSMEQVVPPMPPPHPWPRPALLPVVRPLQPWSPPMPDPAYWHQLHYPRGPRDGWPPTPSALTQGTPCYPQPMRFSAHPAPGIFPHPMYRPPVAVAPSLEKQTAGHQVPMDAHPTNERIDAAIGDVLEKPWLPLPLGLKAPSLDSVMGELQRQGISNIPPTNG